MKTIFLVLMLYVGLFAQDTTLSAGEIAIIEFRWGWV